MSDEEATGGVLHASVTYGLMCVCVWVWAVVDDTEDFEAFGIEDDYYIPVIHIYYKDDLTVA